MLSDMADKTALFLGFFLTRWLTPKTLMQQITTIMNATIITMTDVLILNNWDFSTGTGGLSQSASSEN